MAELFGSWSLSSLIAVGGLGEVWRATSIEPRFEGIAAAVKRLHTHLARNDEAREMFATEQMLAMSLPRHPGVQRGLEPGIVDGRPFIAFELAPGEDLRRIVAPPANRNDGGPALEASLSHPTLRISVGHFPR